MTHIPGTIYPGVELIEPEPMTALYVGGGLVLVTFAVLLTRCLILKSAQDEPINLRRRMEHQVAPLGFVSEETRRRAALAAKDDRWIA